MNKKFKKFLLGNVILTLAGVLIGLVVFSFFFPEHYSPLMILILLFTFTINVIVFGLITRKNNSSPNIMLDITKSFAIKFFSYLGLFILIISLEKDKQSLIILILLAFLLYIIYTIFEVKAFVDHAKEK